MKGWVFAGVVAAPAPAWAEGFDERLVAAVANIEPGAYAVLTATVYIMGLCGFGAGLLRLARMSNRYASPPTGAGTVLCFATGTAMFAFPSWLESGAVSLFGLGPRVDALSYGGGVGAAEYNALLASLFVIVEFVGLVSFLRGWLVLRAAADGGQRTTMGSGVWHIVGGLLGWHIVPVLHAVQSTMGLELLRPG